MRSRPGLSGFTLLELLVVISIMSLLVAVMPPLVSRALPGAELRNTARELAAALVTARSRAMTRNRSVVLQLDLRNKAYSIHETRAVNEAIAEARDPERENPPGNPPRGRGNFAETKLPDGVAVTLYGADTEIPSEITGGIRFFPDGSSSGGRIVLERDGRSYRIDVDWLLGSVSVHG